MDDIVKPSLTPPKHLGGGYKDNLLPGFPGKPGMTERKKSEDDIRGGGMTGLLFRPLQRKKDETSRQRRKFTNQPFRCRASPKASASF